MPKQTKTPTADGFGITAAMVRKFMRSTTPGSLKGVKNFYLAEATELGPKAVVGLLSGQSRKEFHAYRAVLALLELGVPIRARRAFKGSNQYPAFKPFVQSGLLQFDEEEAAN